jgi:hypothetical protein
MLRPLVAIFHQPPREGDPPLTSVLAEARDRLVSGQARLFTAAGAARVLLVPGREDGSIETFGERLVRLVADEGLRSGLIVLGSGAVPLLNVRDARQLIAAASSAGRTALTNNRYSSDVCAISDVAALRDLPPLPSDNALPRWLEERAGFTVGELTARDRLAIDLDTPLDLALLALVRATPQPLRELAAEHGIHVPRLDDLRALAADPRRELLVFGRSGSRTLKWLERNVRCRVRFLAEERGLRASSPLAIGGAIGDASAGAAGSTPRGPAATLGLLLDQRGPDELASVVRRLADGAIIDSRVLMAHRFGGDEDTWPSAEDRFASDLLDSRGISDPWLRALTISAAESPIPIQLGSHTLVGPGIPLLLAVTPR